MNKKEIEICLAASFNKDPVQPCVVEQTEETCRAAILKGGGFPLKFVEPKFQTPELRLAAVSQNGLALEFIEPEFQTAEICLAAAEENESALEFIKNEDMKINIRRIMSSRK